MGTMKHHVIVVTSWNAPLLAKAHAEAERLGCKASPLVPSAVNRYASFLIAPDGSNEGWEASDAGDARRSAFIQWAREQREEDGGNALEWVEVAYCSGEGEAEITDHEWRDRPWEIAEADREEPQSTPMRFAGRIDYPVYPPDFIPIADRERADVYHKAEEEPR